MATGIADRGERRCLSCEGLQSHRQPWRRISFSRETGAKGEPSTSSETISRLYGVFPRRENCGLQDIEAESARLSAAPMERAIQRDW